MNKEKNELEELEKEFDRLVEEGHATKEEVESAKKSLRRLATKKATTPFKRFLKRVSGFLLSILLYMIIYSACYGFFHNRTFTPNKGYPFIFFLILIIFQLSLRNILTLPSLKRKMGSIAGYAITFILTFILLLILHPYIYFIRFDHLGILSGFYLLCEGLYLMVRYDIIKRKFM